VIIFIALPEVRQHRPGVLIDPSQMLQSQHDAIRGQPAPVTQAPPGLMAGGEPFYWGDKMKPSVYGSAAPLSNFSTRCMIFIWIGL
jgi:hypothetical protein